LKKWKFEIDSYDETFVWIGDYAIDKTFTAENRFIYNNHNKSPQTNTIEFKSNTFYPIRIIYTNEQGIYYLITRPDGVVLNNGDSYFFNSNFN
jgi:hypothetical protein